MAAKGVDAVRFIWLFEIGDHPTTNRAHLRFLGLWFSNPTVKSIFIIMISIKVASAECGRFYNFSLDARRPSSIFLALNVHGLSPDIRFKMNTRCSMTIPI